MSQQIILFGNSKNVSSESSFKYPIKVVENFNELRNELSKNNIGIILSLDEIEFRKFSEMYKQFGKDFSKIPMILWANHVDLFSSWMKPTVDMFLKFISCRFVRSEDIKYAVDELLELKTFLDKITFIKKYFEIYGDISEYFSDEKKVELIYNIVNGISVEQTGEDGLYELCMGVYENVKDYSEHTIAERNKWYLSSIEKGNKYAMHCYANTIINIEEAKKYYLMAIEKGNADSMYEYAMILEDVNIEESKRYFLMAIEKGNVNAMKYYADLLLEDENMEECKKYYLMAIKNGHVNALHTYALLVTEENPKESVAYYYKYYKLTGDPFTFNKIKNILNTDHMVNMIGELFEKELNNKNE